MQTRSSSNLPVESSPNPSTSNPKHRNLRRSKQPFILKESLVDTMVDQRTMTELLRAPTEGYAEAIMVPSILAEQFELKHSLINMMTSDHGDEGLVDLMKVAKSDMGDQAVLELEVQAILEVLNETWNFMKDDIEHHQRQILNNPCQFLLSNAVITTLHCLMSNELHEATGLGTMADPGADEALDVEALDVSRILIFF
uniref:Reverse transcriptase domain-containing protein n=1 Tax=Tanacetum cinerariifolium TaxID=118510 RepID=A0A6L2MRY4_TANCI|nr:reverse transcriptase domain-containing protein [Tanacetum cinerariifolium]